MLEEMKSLQKNHANSFLKLSKGKKVLKNNWIYKLKAYKNNS